jgi:hypothetical protein
VSPSHGHFRGGKRIVLPIPVDPVIPATNRDTEDFLYGKGLTEPLRTDGKFPDWGKHDLTPGFTHTYDWRHGARPGVDGPPWPYTYNGTDGWDHMNGWFEAIPAEGGMPATHRNCRLQISIPKVHFYTPSTDTWTAQKTDADFTKLDGGYWNGDKDLGGYDKVVDWPSTEPNSYWRTETVGWSVDLNPTVNSDGTVKTSQCIAHGFWPSAFSTRLFISGADTHISIVGWVRLITDSGTVDVNQAKYVGRISGDAFLESTGSNTLPDGRIVNPPLGQNRMLQLTSAWKPTGWISGDEATVREVVKSHPLLGEAPPS